MHDQPDSVCCHECHPTLSDGVLCASCREQFRQLYQTYYHPNRTGEWVSLAKAYMRSTAISEQLIGTGMTFAQFCQLLHEDQKEERGH